MTDMLVSILKTLYNFFDNVIPVITIAENPLTQIASSAATLMDFYDKVNYIVPLTDFTIIISTWTIIHVGQFLIFGINWIVRRICDLIP